MAGRRLDGLGRLGGEQSLNLLQDDLDSFGPTRLAIAEGILSQAEEADRGVKLDAIVNRVSAAEPVTFEQSCL